MLTAKRITRQNETLKQVKHLYREAFPAAERVPIKYLIGDDATGELAACYDGELFCGFYATITVGDIVCILFLAVEPQLRDRGYGGQILELITDRAAGRRIMLDIEAPDIKADNYEQRIRRKQFYIKNGYRETEIAYDWRGVSYEILITNGTISEAEFDAFWDSLDDERRDEL